MFSLIIGAGFIIYLFIIAFPQVFFAYEISHKNLRVYARVPLDKNTTDQLLEKAEERLEKSPIYDADSTDRIFLTGSHALYAFLSNRAYASFGNSVPEIDNILINKADVAKDLVYAPRDEPNERPLSDVIAHEVTHLMIRRKFGVFRSIVSIPAWKNEGYCEYVAGATTLSFEDGKRLWKANAKDERLKYFKYHQMVKYLLDEKEITVEELFEKDFDEKELEQKIYTKICQN